MRQCWRHSYHSPCVSCTYRSVWSARDIRLSAPSSPCAHVHTYTRTHVHRSLKERRTGSKGILRTSISSHILRHAVSMTHEHRTHQHDNASRFRQGTHVLSFSDKFLTCQQDQGRIQGWVSGGNIHRKGQAQLWMTEHVKSCNF